MAGRGGGNLRFHLSVTDGISPASWKHDGEGRGLHTAQSFGEGRTRARFVAPDPMLLVTGERFSKPQQQAQQQATQLTGEQRKKSGLELCSNSTLKMFSDKVYQLSLTSNQVQAWRTTATK